jgi:nucleotide-binding universal stress UspA family protein
MRSGRLERDDRDVETQPILICYDGSTESERAIDTAAALFGPRNAVVVDVSPIMTVAESVTATASLVPGNAYDDLNKSASIERAEDGAAYARVAGFTATPRGELANEVWAGIVNAADDVDAAVIVIGSRGLSGVRERVRGSVSHDVATHAHRPVLIVPPPAE